MLPDHVTSKELAEVLGVTQRQVQLLASRGVLPQLRRDRFNLCTAVQAHTAYREGITEERLGASGPESYGEGRRRKIWEETKRLEAQRLVRENRMVDRERVVDSWITIYAGLKTTLWGVPTRLAPYLARLSDPHECEALLRRELRAVMNRLAGVEPVPGFIHKDEEIKK
jgi:phage terminase Nu1 subunit (DNA packaging protein)